VVTPEGDELRVELFGDLAVMTEILEREVKAPETRAAIDAGPVRG
jgi:hypothetical protein